MSIRSWHFEIKDIGDQGNFTGIASVYNVVDNGDDVVEPGAFTKTIADKGDTRPLLWQHRDPIGTCILQDSPSALLLQGKLCLGVQAGKDALTLLKDGVVKGLSIGFQTVRYDIVGGVRHLKELKLWEVSLVTFPMNEQALVTGVKGANNREVRRALRSFKSDILAALERS